MSVILSLTSRSGFKLPHRQMKAGEELASLEFASQADADFFKGQLRWSAFALIQESNADAPADTTAPKRRGRPPKAKPEDERPGEA